MTAVAFWCWRITAAILFVAGIHAGVGSPVANALLLGSIAAGVLALSFKEGK